MTTEASLLAALAADPDDDDARLVLADWFAQRGDPRGELMQLEVAHAKMPGDDDRRKPTAARITELRDLHGEAWLAPFAKLSRELRFSLDRGLVGHVAGEVPTLAKFAREILTRAALVRGVAIELARDLGPLAGSPLLDRMRTLSIAGSRRVAGWSALGDLPEIRTLSLQSLALGPEDLEALFAAPRLTKLETLGLSLCRLNKGAVEPFARLRCTLRALDMPAYHLGPRLGQILGDSPTFHALTTLTVPGSDLGREGLVGLLPALRHVEHLDLRGCALAATDLPLLLDVAVVPQLRILELGGNKLGDAGAEQVARFAGAHQLTKLHLGDAGITGRGARVLANAASLANLRSLVLSGPRFTETVDAELVASPHLAKARIYAGNRQLARTKPAPPKRTKRS